MVRCRPHPDILPFLRKPLHFHGLLMVNLIERRVRKGARRIPVRLQQEHIHGKPGEQLDKHGFLPVPTAAQIDETAGICLPGTAEQLRRIPLQPAEQVDCMAGQPV